MTAITRLLRRRLGRELLDAWLSFWGCLVGGAALSGFAAAAVWRHAKRPAELFLGTMAAVVAALLLALLGVLARRVHLAASDGRAPWRVRQWELVSHAAGPAALGSAGWALAAISPGIADAVTGAMLALGAYAAVLCLGCWSTLARSERTTAGT